MVVVGVSFEVAFIGVAFGLERQLVAFIVAIVVVSIRNHLGCIDLFGHLVSLVFVGC